MKEGAGSGRSRRWVGVALLLVVAGVGALLWSSLAPAESVPSDAAAPVSETSGAGALPPDVMPVVFVAGTPYEMGYQLGQQAGDMIVRNVTLNKAGILAEERFCKAQVYAEQAQR